MFILVVLWFAFEEEQRARGWLLLFWAGVLAVVFPLVVVNTKGARLWYAPVILADIVLLAMIVRVIQRYRLQKAAVPVLTALALIAVLHYGRIYLSIGQTDRARQAAIREALSTEQSEIYLPLYEYPEYVWCPEPAGDDNPEKEVGWRRDYKYFYGIPQEVKIYFKES